jgi:hypothetical protein
MKKIKCLALITALFVGVFAFSTISFAETTAASSPELAVNEAAEIDEDDSAEDINDVKPDPASTEADTDNDADDIVTPTFITDVSTYFSVAETEVEKLNTAGAEQGEIFFTCYFASQTQKSTSEIAQLKATGKGWGEIAKDNNLHPGSHGRAMGAFRSGGKAGGN